MPGSVRVGGAWKTVAKASVKVGGAWKNVAAAYTKVGGAWKQWYSSSLPNYYWINLIGHPSSGAYEVRGFDITRNSANEFITAGGTGTELATVFKYDAFGAIQWQKTFNHQVNYSVEVDASNSIYLTGKTGNTYIHLTKLDTNGNLSWSRQYRYSNYGYPEWSKVALDASSNAYVGQILPSTNTFTAYGALSKFNSSGTHQWSRTYMNSVNDNWTAGGATYHSSGIYLSGYGQPQISGSRTNSQLVIKHDANGSILWQRAAYNAIGGGETMYPYGSAVDANGNLFLATQNYNNPNSTILKYASDGTLSWSRRIRWRATGNGQYYKIWLYGCATDDAGNVYVTGKSVDNYTSYRGVIIKFDTNGNMVWQRSITDGYYDYPLGRCKVVGNALIINGYSTYQPYRQTTMSVPIDGSLTATYTVYSGRNLVYAVATEVTIELTNWLSNAATTYSNSNADPSITNVTPTFTTTTFTSNTKAMP